VVRGSAEFAARERGHSTLPAGPCHMAQSPRLSWPETRRVSRPSVHSNLWRIGHEQTRSRPRSRTAFSRSFCQRPSERRRRQNGSPSTAQPNTEANRLEMERSRRLKEAAGMAYKSLVFKIGPLANGEGPIGACRALSRQDPGSPGVSRLAGVCRDRSWSTRHHRSGALAISRSEWIKIERTIQIC
jgi:hypothetical protein